MFFQSLLTRPEIGANSYLIDLDGARVILDAGMHPALEGAAALPHYEDVEFDSVDAVVVSHAHHDHIGSLPVLQRRQPRARVFMSEPTARLGSAMLHNSVNVMSSQREELGITEYPFFTHREVEEAEGRWEWRGLGRAFELGQNGARGEMHDAGHILGSVGTLLRAHGQTILYTGDVQFENQTLTQGAALPTEKVDTLILETTRGDHQRRPDYTRQGEALRLAAAVRDAVKRGGSVLMPVFALGKSQELLMVLHELQRQGEIPALPTFIGGLSLKVSKIYDDFADHPRRLNRGFQILRDLPELQFNARPRRGQPRQPVRYQPGAIFALSSGMMTENTLSHEFAFQFVENPANAVLFVGYTQPESPAGLLRQTPRGEQVLLNPKRSPLKVNCEVHAFDFSGHADRDSLRAYARGLKPRRILLVHGEEGALRWFQEALQQDLPGCEVIIPAPGERISLS